MRTIVPLSGGLDSATVLAGCVASGDECLGLLFDYAQPHRIELKAAENIAMHYEINFERYLLPELPKVNQVVFAGRNLVFASFAIAKAQAENYDRVAFGCNASDWRDFPDCRPEFWRNVERCAELYGVKVLTPLIYMSKRDVVQTALRLDVPIDLTWSCYNPQDEKPCGECLACKTREEALA